jgi:hypothetical protein
LTMRGHYGCSSQPSRIITFYLNPIKMMNARSYQSAVPVAVGRYSRASLSTMG